MDKKEKLKALEAMGTQFMVNHSDNSTGKPYEEMGSAQLKGIWQNPVVGPAKRLKAYRLWAPKNVGHELIPEILDITDDNQVFAFLKGQDAGRATSNIQG